MQKERKEKKEKEKKEEILLPSSIPCRIKGRARPLMYNFLQFQEQELEFRSINTPKTFPLEVISIHPSNPNIPLIFEKNPNVSEHIQIDDLLGPRPPSTLARQTLSQEILALY